MVGNLKMHDMKTIVERTTLEMDDKKTDGAKYF